MKTRIFLMAGIMGLAVVSGICRSLASPRGGAKKEEEEKAREKSCGAGAKL
jgi:hypothetical protein